MLGSAIKIASEAHEYQTRWNGEPYILHPLRVMNALKQCSETVKCVAVLHDVLEDTYVTPELLFKKSMSGEVVDAIILLTHQRGESYSLYIERLKLNPIARIVKLADLRDNMDVSQIPANMMGDRSLKRLAKYYKAYSELSL